MPEGWITIAERSRDTRGKLRPLEWHELADAPYRIESARRLAAQGILLIANRHYEDRVELVVRPTRRSETQQRLCATRPARALPVRPLRDKRS
jgi:hypothetical protein